MAEVTLGFRVTKTGDAAEKLAADLTKVGASAKSAGAEASAYLRGLEAQMSALKAKAATGVPLSVQDARAFTRLDAEIKKVSGSYTALTATASPSAAAVMASGAAAQQTAGKLMALGNSLTSLGTRMSIGVTAPLALIAKKAIDAASDTAESIDKMKRVFGAASPIIEQLGETSADALGMSKQEAVEAASTFGNLFNTIGLGQQTGAEMSARLVQLAADMASFNNENPTEMLDKLRSGLAGEAEPLRRFGALLNESRVAQEAVRLGLARTTQQVSEAAKVQARYSLILQDTAPQQGNFADTADGMANSLRSTEAALKNAAAELGTALIPMAKTAAVEVKRLAEAFAQLDPAAQTSIARLGGLLIVLGPLATGFGVLARATAWLIPFLTTGGALATTFGIAIGSLVAGILTLSDQATSRTLSEEDADAVIGLPSREVIEKRLANVRSLIQIAKANLNANPADEIGLINLSKLQLQEDQLEATLRRVEGAVQHGVHSLTPLAWTQNDVATSADKAGAAITRESAIFDKLTGGQNTGEALAKTLTDLGNAAMLGPLSDAQMEKWQLLLELLSLGNAEAIKLRDSISQIGTTINAPAAVMQRDYGLSQDLIGPTRLEAEQYAGEQRLKAIQAAQDADQKRIKTTQTAAERAADAVAQKFRDLAAAITSAIDDARKKAAGLFDLGGGAGPGGIVTEPGKGGPFEALYRITDMAATAAGRAPGKETAKWQEMYGPALSAAGTTATAAATAFQQGNLLAPGVFENIDWKLLGAQASAADQGSKISTYAGQAAAALMASGKELTPENMQAMINQLAEQDKENMVPKLEDIAKVLRGTDTTQHQDLLDVIKAVDKVTAAVTKPPAPTAPPTAGTTGSTTTTTPPTTKNPKGQKGYASGTAFAPGGFALVGEQGPELVRLPTGSQVSNTQQTRQMLAGGTAGPGASEQFITALVAAVGGKARDVNEAAASLADMLVAAAASSVQSGMIRQLGRR